MTDNPRAVIGGNAPPDPIDEAVAPFASYIEEAENWADGTPVQTEAQMKAVDALVKQLKAARKAVDEARDTATKPLHDAWKSEVARWKPTQDDLDRRVKCLVALGDGFKQRLAAEKEAARRKAAAEAAEARRVAEEAARQASASDLAAQEAAAMAQREAEEAQRRASAAAKDKVTGLRTVTTYHMIDAEAMARHLWKNDRAAMDEYMAARGKALGLDLPGVFEQRKEKAAY